jgi:hypothetical protein
MDAADVEALIDALDPGRDFGEFSYEEIVAQVRDGELAISPGLTSDPLLRNTATGKAVKGTGQTVALQSVKDLAELRAHIKTVAGREWLDSRLLGTWEPPHAGAITDRDEIYNQMMVAIRNHESGWEKLAMFHLQQHVGKPRETGQGGMGKAVELLINKLGAGGEQTSTEIRIVEQPLVESRTAMPGFEVDHE